MFMKLNFVCAFIAAFACSAFLISTANAGGRHGGVGLSSAGASMSSTATNSTVATNGGPIGGFVVSQTPLPPAQRAPDLSRVAVVGSTGTSTGSTSGSSTTAGQLVGSSISTATAAHSNDGGRVRVTPVRKNPSLPELPNITGGSKPETVVTNGSSSRSSNGPVIFSPPPGGPTKEDPQVKQTGAGGDKAAADDRVNRMFRRSILNAGLPKTDGSH